MTGETPRRLTARRGFSVSYQGKTLLSLIDPIGQAEKIVDALPKSEGTLYFCPSPLYGYGLDRLLARMGPGSAVLCVEADEGLMALSLEALPEGPRGDPRLRLVRTSDAGALCAYTRKTWGERRFRRVTELRLSGGWRIGEEAYRNLAEALRRDIATGWGNAMTLVKLGRRYIRNAIRNLALVSRAPTIGALDFGAAPVLVLGAGPSLDGILAGLAGFAGTEAEAGRPFRIICVDTCLRALRAWGIKPDLVVALESQHWNLRDFLGLGDWRIPVAMDLSALPATREVLGGRSYLFVTPWAPLRLLTRLGEEKLLPETLPPLGSVGLTAVALACRIGSGPVLTGGIDFSFSLDRFHARAAPGSLERVGRHNRLRGIINAEAAFRPGVFTAPSKTGETVRSDPALRGYRDLFEREFAREKRLLDIAGPGLPLGLRTVSPEAAFAVLGGGKVPGACPGEPSPGEDPSRGSPAAAAKARRTEAFIIREREALARLRRVLTGGETLAATELEGMLDEADYLWAHFPDCAAAGGRRPALANRSFLNRVRVEIDPFIDLFDLTLGELRKS
jgi:hypothetical protein